MRLKKIINLSFTCFGLLCIQATSVVAATATGTIAVTATVLSTCTVAALPLAFGNYASIALPATTTLTVSCSLNTTYTVGLDAGTGNSASTALRKMTNGANTLNYQLFKDAARTQNFGNTAGTDTVSGTGNGLAQVITVYGQVVASQFPAVGLYSDLVTATLTY